MGGAQPLAATMAGAAILCVEVDPARIERRLETRYLDEAAESLDDALARVRAAAARGAAALGRPARQRRRGRAGARAARRALRPRHRPDRGARSAHRLRARAGSTSRRPRRCASAIPDEYLRRARESIARHVAALLEYVRARQLRFRLWQQPARGGAGGGRRGRLRIPGLRPGLYPAALLPRHRAVPLGGALRRPGRHRRDRPRCCSSCSRTTTLLQRWLELAPERVAFQGLPARICWLGYGDRATRGARDQRAGPRAARSRRRS